MASWLVCSTPERAVRVQALARDIVLCSWARHLTLTVPLSTQVYKWVLANCWGKPNKLQGSDLRWTSIPSIIIIVVLVTPQWGCVRPHVNSFHFVRSFATCSICVHEVKLSLRHSLSRPRASNWLSPVAIICETSSGVSQVTVSIPSKASVIDIAVSVIINFLGEWVINPQPNLMTRRAGRLLLVWTLTIDLSGMGGPTRRNKSPVSVALRFTEPDKPLHHDKAAVTTERSIQSRGSRNTSSRFMLHKPE